MVAYFATHSYQHTKRICPSFKQSANSLLANKQTCSYNMCKVSKPTALQSAQTRGTPFFVAARATTSHLTPSPPTKGPKTLFCLLTSVLYSDTRILYHTSNSNLSAPRTLSIQQQLQALRAFPNNTAIMSSIVDGLTNLISSIFEIFQGIFSTILSGIQSVFGLAQNLISSIFDLMSGLVGFILGMSFPVLLRY